MDSSTFSARPFSDSDYESWAAVGRAARPDVPVSAENLRHQEESLGSDFEKRRFVVEFRDTGRVIAVGRLGESPFNAEHGKFWEFILVHPEYQGRGIGTWMHDRLVAEARTLGATSLRAAVQEREAIGTAFLNHRGFQERRRTWQSTLDPGRVDVSRLPDMLRALASEGIEITTLAEEGVEDPEVIRKLYELDRDTSPDVPRMDPFTPWTLEQYARLELGGPRQLPEAWFIAKHQGRYIAMSVGKHELANRETLHQSYTCTLREYRRRGIALALKLSLIEYAQEHRYRRIETENDSMNAPMWAMNERLGFRRSTIWIQMERPLQPPGLPPRVRP
jgi:mycothiol synthase